MTLSKIIFISSFFVKTVVFAQAYQNLPRSSGELKLENSGYCFAYNNENGFISGAYPCDGDYKTDVITCGVELRNIFFSKQNLEAFTSGQFLKQRTQEKLKLEQIISVGNCQNLLPHQEKISKSQCDWIQEELENFQQISDRYKQNKSYVPFYFENDDGTFNQALFNTDWAKLKNSWNQLECDKAKPIVADYIRLGKGNNCNEANLKIKKIAKELAQYESLKEAAKENNSKAIAAYNECIKTRGDRDVDNNLVRTSETFD